MGDARRRRGAKRTKNPGRKKCASAADGRRRLITNRYRCIGGVHKWTPREIYDRITRRDTEAASSRKVNWWLVAPKIAGRFSSEWRITRPAQHGRPRRLLSENASNCDAPRQPSARSDIGTLLRADRDSKLECAPRSLLRLGPSDVLMPREMPLTVGRRGSNRRLTSDHLSSGERATQTYVPTTVRIAILTNLMNIVGTRLEE
ncbi:unnamed protein product, partial [Iphiclides podalirius]